MTRSIGGAGLALVAVLLASGGARADYHDKGIWTLVIENDVLTVTQTDRNYTAGHHISYLSPPNDLVTGRFGHAIVNALFAPGSGPGVAIHDGFALTHTFFTPEDLDATEPLPGQHPYAGWLYGSYTLLARRPVNERVDVIDSLTLDLGIVGPSALAEEVQRGFHQLIDGADPQGWDNQLKDEPGLVLSLERQWRIPIFGNGQGPRRIGMDFLPTLGGSAGNVLTQAKAGGTLRIGYRLGEDYGPPRIRPSLAGAAYYDVPAGGFGFYLFAGAEIRAVARNIFLDGNTWRDSLSVERKPLVGDFQVGAVLQTRYFQLAYTFVNRTEEFEGQKELQEFGSLSLSMRF